MYGFEVYKSNGTLAFSNNDVGFSVLTTAEFSMSYGVTPPAMYPATYFSGPIVIGGGEYTVGVSSFVLPSATDAVKYQRPIPFIRIPVGTSINFASNGYVNGPNTYGIKNYIGLSAPGSVKIIEAIYLPRQDLTTLKNNNFGLELYTDSGYQSFSSEIPRLHLTGKVILPDVFNDTTGFMEYPPVPTQPWIIGSIDVPKLQYYPDADPYFSLSSIISILWSNTETSGTYTGYEFCYFAWVRRDSENTFSYGYQKVYGISSNPLSIVPSLRAGKNIQGSVREIPILFARY